MCVRSHGRPNPRRIPSPRVLALIMASVRLGTYAVSSIVLAALVGCTSVPDDAGKVSSQVPPVQDPNKSAMLHVGACLEERGWEVVDAASGEVKVAEEQLELFNEDLNACTEAVQGQEFSTLTDAELEKYYPFVLAEAECLEELGFDLDVPSVQVFVDTYRDDPFVPRAEVGPVSAEESDRLNRMCPPADWSFARN